MSYISFIQQYSTIEEDSPLSLEDISVYIHMIMRWDQLLEDQPLAYQRKKQLPELYCGPFQFNLNHQYETWNDVC